MMDHSFRKHSPYMRWSLDLIDHYFKVPRGEWDNFNNVHAVLVKAGWDLMCRVDDILTAVGAPEEVEISSGYRTFEQNEKAGGRKNSYHMRGMAVDLSDPDGSIYQAILSHGELLKEYGLWMEKGEFTKGWVHLDTGKRTARKIQIFKP